VARSFLRAVRFLRFHVGVHRTLLTIAGAIAGAGIAAARHRERRAERLAAATLETLLNAIDANDAVTGAHVRRVAAYALVIADALGLDQRRCRDLERVALFHDIGKLHAALFDIIHDDDELTPEEREAVATHPRRGADVLAPLAAFYPSLADGVLAHHERWDGTGYPRGLRSTSIPLASRIVAVADTFDAITESRRYHRGEEVGKAVDVIRGGRGAQFDPEVVDAFLSASVLERITAILHEGREATPRRAGANRRHASETGAPDISFRWRERVASPSRAPQEAGA
jgi:HD-GYP domain-containing protein (c-di-GMP phosphodiesterase class II)